MVVYFGLYSILVLCLFAKPSSKGKKKSRKAFIFLLVLFVLLLGLRHPIMGQDLQYGSRTGYLGMFETIGKTSWQNIWLNSSIVNSDSTDFLNYEFGYVAFNKLVSLFGTNYTWFLCVCAFVSLLPIFVILRKNSENFEFSLIIYLALPCFLMLFSGVRQAIAIGLCFASYSFIVQKKLVKFVLLVLVAFLFHSSAILFLIAFPVYYFPIKKKYRFITLLLIFVVFVFRTQLFYLLAPLLDDSAKADNNGALALFLVFILVYIFCCYFSKDCKKDNGLLNLFLIAILCQAFGNIFASAARVGFYFMPFICLLLPKVLKNIRNPERSLISIPIYSIFIIYGLYSLYSNGSSWPMTYPWVPFWN